MKIIGVIPARYQSSRFPGKPLADINGKPMIWWVYQQVKEVRMFEAVYVATDSIQIYEVCVKNNINVMLTADSHQTGTDRLSEVAQKVPADFYVNIQGDEPLIEPETIEAVINYKISNPEVEIINTTAPLSEENVLIDTIVKVVSTKTGDLIYLSRSPIPYPKNGQSIQYYRHLGLYGISKKALLFFGSSRRSFVEKIEDIEMLRFLENGYKIKVIKVESDSIGVDRPEDIEKVKKAIRRKNDFPRIKTER